MTKIAVDTHILIWGALEPEKISNPAKQAIEAANENGVIIVADISLWEIAMLIHKERITVNTDCQSFINLVLQSNETIVRSISPAIAAKSIELDNQVNADPADRLIAATALIENIPLVTADRNLRNAKIVQTIW